MTPARRTAALELLRYTVAVGVGLGIDLSVALAVNRLLGLPLVAGAAIGFVGGILSNYLLFELWVFGTRQLRWARLGRIVLAAQAALALRLGAVWLLDRLGVPPLPTLVAGAGVSFAVNFFVSRRIISAMRAGG